MCPYKTRFTFVKKFADCGLTGLPTVQNVPMISEYTSQKAK